MIKKSYPSCRRVHLSSLALLILGLFLTILGLFLTINAASAKDSLPRLATAQATTAAKANPATSDHQLVNTLLVIGDSLSAGYGIAKKDGWVEILKQRLSSSYYHIDVINASVSGETTFGGLNRTPSLLNKYAPQIALIELGGNDGLQGLPLSDMEHNLEQIVSLLHKRGIRVLLLGMKLPPNYGQFYTKSFEQVYQRVAEKYSVELVPFMLNNIVTKKDLMQKDGIHPRAEAQREILDNIWPHLQKLLPKPQLN